MNKGNSIKKNFIYNLIYNLLNIIVPLITAPYTSRVLGADKIGIYSYTYSLVSTVIMIGALGAATYGQKEIAAAKNDDERNHLFWEIFIIKGITTFLCSAFFMVYAYSDKYLFYYCIQLPFFVAAIFDISWLFQGVEKFNYIAIRNSVVRIAGIALLFLLVKSPDDLWKYLLIICGSQLVGNLSMWAYIGQFVGKPSYDKSNTLHHIKNMMVYFIPSVTYQIYAVLDKAMLGWIVGSDYENGFYEQAHKIVNMVISVISAYTVVMRSRMSFLYSKRDYSEINKKLRKSSDVIAFMVFPMSFGLTLISASMVPWFFGDGYDAVITLLYVFAPIFVFMGYSRLIGTHILTPSGRQGKSNIAQCSAAGINLIMNMVLIPKYKSVGAAVASVTAEFAIVAIYYYMIRKEFPLKIVLSTGWKKFLSSIIMFFVMWKYTQNLSPTIVTTFIIILLGSIVYIIMLVILRDDFIVEYLCKLKERVFKWGKLRK